MGSRRSCREGPSSQSPGRLQDIIPAGPSSREAHWRGELSSTWTTKLPVTATLREYFHCHYDIITASSAVGTACSRPPTCPDARALYAANPVDALLIGIMLEMLDGFSITSCLKKEKKVSRPIVAWSSETSGPLEAHLMESGADMTIDEGRADACLVHRNFLRDRLS